MPPTLFPTAARRATAAALATALLLAGASPARAGDGTTPPPTPLQGVDDPTLALGLAGYRHHTTNMPFIDMMKVQRPMGQGGDNPVDDHGWVIRLRQPTKGTRFKVGGRFAPAQPSRRGRWVVRYDGKGDFALRSKGASLVKDRPGRKIVADRKGDGWTLALKRTDPHDGGDYVRDVTIMKEIYVDLHEVGALFNPEWLSVIADAREIRFMDWMRTNGSVGRDVGHMTAMAQQTWIDGTPVEAMVRLANQIGADPWFTMPFGASEAYLRRFAAYVRDHLDPRLVATVEMSNETWNEKFEQTRALREATEAAWGEIGGHRLDGYHTKLATRVALVWDEAFGEAAERRLRHVLAGQLGHHARNRHRMSAARWFEHEPDAAIAPSAVFDAFAVTTYFGASLAKGKRSRKALVAARADPSVDAVDLAFDWLSDPANRSSVPRVIDALVEAEAMATEHGLDLVLYEGGQHVHIGVGDDAFNGFLASLARHERMADLYLEIWTAWEGIGDGPFMHFADVRRPNRWGTWSMIDALGITNPVHRALVEANATRTPWWETGRDPAAFKHGIHHFGTDAAETVAGTVEEDYLLGRAGDDRLFGFDGDDGLHGGAGDDRLAGGPGDDRLVGGPGDDVLEAGAGADVLAGGPGRDRFVIGPSPTGEAPQRVLEDFDAAEDALVLDGVRVVGRREAEGGGVVFDLDDGGTLLSRTPLPDPAR